jgi:CubicO group peptidase (beta-lactamase class C family)
VGNPGETFVYNTGGSHLLSVILTEVTGQDTAEYAEEKLFEPLGIEPGRWQRSPQGETNGGFGLELRARDMAKLGYLYLNLGRWDGEQIVPEDYVRASTTWQSAGDATGGWAAYGYQWWVTATAAGYPAYFALGYGGQHIFVVPDLDLVVVAAIERRVPREELRTPRYIIESIVAATAPDA